MEKKHLNRAFGRRRNRFNVSRVLVLNTPPARRKRRRRFTACRVHVLNNPPALRDHFGLLPSRSTDRHLTSSTSPTANLSAGSWNPGSCVYSVT